MIENRGFTPVLLIEAPASGGIESVRMVRLAVAPTRDAAAELALAAMPRTPCAVGFTIEAAHTLH